jgi:hypothetical protein
LGGNPGRKVRPGEPLGQQLLDLLQRLIRGRGQEILGRVLGEIWRQEHHPAQVQSPLGDGIEDHREAPGGTGRADAPVSRRLGSAQMPNSVLEHGRPDFVRH